MQRLTSLRYRYGAKRKLSLGVTVLAFNNNTQEKGGSGLYIVSSRPVRATYTVRPETLSQNKK